LQDIFSSTIKSLQLSPQSRATCPSTIKSLQLSPQSRATCTGKYPRAQTLIGFFAVRLRGYFYQINDKVNGRKIVIEERISGAKIMTYKNKVLKFKEITSKAKKQQKPVCNGHKKSQRYVPSAEHPWNNAKYG